MTGMGLARLTEPYTQRKATMTNWDFLTAELTALEQEGFLSHTRTVGSAQDAWITVDGKRVLNLCANNYLGLANHPHLREAAHAAIERFGVGPAAVRSIAGSLSLHQELEQQLAAFKGVEATLTLQSGFNANLAVIPALVQEGDAIFSDELNHASIIDGCRLSRAQVTGYRHCDPDDLAAALTRTLGVRRRLVITDGVFSMDGEIAPLPQIVNVAAQHEALVMVDDAHGEGVLGLGGRGISHHFDLLGQVDIEVGTLSKAFGVIGGYVAGRQVLIEYLKQRTRPYLFSSATTAADVAACIAAVELLQQSHDKVVQLWDNTHFFQERMRALGFDLGHTQTPITPVMVGDAQRAKLLSAQLFNAGIFVQAIAFPTVPRDTARLRVMLSAAHSREDLVFALEIFARLGRECQLIPAA
jgi:glycine C-acetyltransferase